MNQKGKPYKTYTSGFKLEAVRLMETAIPLWVLLGFILQLQHINGTMLPCKPMIT